MRGSQNIDDNPERATVPGNLGLVRKPHRAVDINPCGCVSVFEVHLDVGDTRSGQRHRSGEENSDKE